MNFEKTKGITLLVAAAFVLGACAFWIAGPRDRAPTSELADSGQVRRVRPVAETPPSKPRVQKPDSTPPVRPQPRAIIEKNLAQEPGKRRTRSPTEKTVAQKRPVEGC